MIHLGKISDETRGLPLTTEMAEDEERTMLPGQIYPV
jgi:hypothetical protein